MPVKWEMDSGNLGVFHISGKLTRDEYVSAQNEAEAVIQKLESIKILVILENFSGWERAEGWEDLSFTEQNDPYIVKNGHCWSPAMAGSGLCFYIAGSAPCPH